MARVKKWALLAATAVSLVTGGCRLLGSLPEPTDLDQRLAMMPTGDLALEAPVTIRWNQYQVPYVLAQSDHDAAYAIGLVHAHLRLGQMEMLRRITQGRIAEMAGPPAADFDAAIRAVGLYRAAKASVASMPPETLAWVERFCAGINDYKAKAQNQPYEVRALLLDQDPEPWRPEDVIAIGRIGSIDVSWFDWLRLLPARQSDQWSEVLAEALAPAFEDPVSFGGPIREVRAEEEEGTSAGGGSAGAMTRAGRQLAKFLTGIKRSGSNSMVVGGAKSANGAGMIASDPHLGFVLPNVWLIAGLKTPEVSVVGLMGPGLPIFALGRTPQIAWGGTNLHAASSDLVDVGDLASEQVTTERHDIGVRGWFDRTAENRLTPYGPVITDVDLVREAVGLKKKDEAVWALRWMAHRPSDEITSLLKLLRTDDFDGFREAFRGFSQPGQNMLFADADGNIGQILAARVPRRQNVRPSDLVISPEQADRDWAEVVDATSLPFAYNPAEGFLASSNNRPTDSDPPVGFFFGAPDRVVRAQNALGSDDQVTLDDLKSLQRDVRSRSALKLKQALAERVDDQLGGPAGTLGPVRERAAREIRDWDGSYRRDGAGAVAFEAYITALGERILPDVTEETARDRSDAARFKKYLLKQLSTIDDARLQEASFGALEVAGQALEEFPTWGDMHRLQLRHPLGLVPVVGGKFPVVDLPTGGSSETLQKTAHAPTREKHVASYGSQARHISDLSDPDANYFLLAGGQDGWINSSTFVDQAALWQDGGYIRMPLTADQIEAEFPIVMELTP